MTLLLRRQLADPAVVQPLLAATALSMMVSPFVIRHNRQITRALLRQSGPPQTEAMREARVTLAVAERDHVVICGFGRVGQNIARVLEQTGFEYIALDLDTYRVREGRQAGDPVMYGDAGQLEVLQNVGLARARCVVITFANPAVSLRILRAVRGLRGDVPVLVRTQDDLRLEELQAAGATEVVPETFEASLMLLSHLLLLLKLPMPQVIRTVNDIRSHRYVMLRQYFRKAGAEFLDDNHAFREELHSVVLPPHAWAVGKSIAELAERRLAGRGERRAARRNRGPGPRCGHGFQGRRRRRGVRAAGGRRARRDVALDGIKKLYLSPRLSHSRGAVQGQTRRKVGTQNHRSKGLLRKLDDSGVASSRCAERAFRVPPPGLFPLICDGFQRPFPRIVRGLRGKTW